MAVAETQIEVTVLYALEAQQVLVSLILPNGATAGEAVQLSALTQRFPEIGKRPRLARFGKSVAWTALLEHQDRLDILRPLLADPKEFRRHRAAVQRKRKPG